jgi:two-component system nitrogen regulation response regulator NtrX
MMPERVLIIDDEPNIRRMMEMIHRNAGWETATAPGGAHALELLAREAFDVVFLDLSMPDRDGLEVLADIRRLKPDQLVVILTGQATIDRAVEATRLGAFDFLEKDCGKERILLTSRNARDHSALAGENRKLRSRTGKRREFIGESRAAVEVMAQVRRVAPTPARVLILGESGTGKELLAQAIHDRSPRAGGPFVKVNCAAIPEELIESELFGAERGAYTGAVQAREGRWQAADGGTLFLDEVGDMSLKVQTKVLRALQEGEIQKVGSNEIIRVDVRVIAATNKSLADEVTAGRFREDLYYRLNVVPITVPPLRGRGEDIALLARAFLAEYCAENDMPPKTFDDDVLAALAAYPWPGNVRELRNQVERVAIMCPGRVVRVDDLSADVRSGAPSVARVRSSRASDLARVEGKSLHDACRQLEHDLIAKTLEKFNWNVSRAAEALGLERTNLHKKMKALGIERKAGG